jgi:hypothetical protein
MQRENNLHLKVFRGVKKEEFLFDSPDDLGRVSPAATIKTENQDM